MTDLQPVGLEAADPLHAHLNHITLLSRPTRCPPERPGHQSKMSIQDNPNSDVAHVGNNTPMFQVLRMVRCLPTRMPWSRTSKNLLPFLSV